MKIVEVTDEHILFDNGHKITFDHEQDCCEYNYADFSQLTPETVGYDAEFTEPLDFAFLCGKGFLFGNLGKAMIFVPCYSEQNGYYSTEIDIYYNGTKILCGRCEERIY